MDLLLIMHAEINIVTYNSLKLCHCTKS